MRLLLDTHVFLWAASAPERLSDEARIAIEDTASVVFVSSAVGWEIAIKYSLGKLTLPTDPQMYVPSRISALGFQQLSIAQEHALVAGSLPYHHRDPFDRVMIAQAILENLTLVTRDPIASRYARVLVT